jgi:iron complex outermembrane receptor protein
VEVVEGPGSWLYGDGAVGGIVNIVRDEWRAGLRPRATVRVGSFEQEGGSLGASWGTSLAALSLEGSGRDVEGWRDRNRERIRSAHAMTSWRPGRASLALDASWLDADREDPGALTREQMDADRTQAENPGDFTNSERLLLNLTLQHGDPARQQWTLAPYARIEEFDQVRTLVSMPMLHPTSGTTVGADLGWRAELGDAGSPLVLSAGYQVEGATLRSRYYAWDGAAKGVLLAHGESERLTQSGFVASRWDVSEMASARLGLRYDAIRIEFEDRQSGSSEGPRTLAALSPLMAISVRRGQTLIYGSWSGAFHAPTLNQLYDRRPFFFFPADPPFNISNAELDPQRSLGFELGARWIDAEGRSASLTLYDLFVRDEIDFDLATFSYANIQRSRHSGALLALRLPLGSRLAVLASGTLSPTVIRGGARDGNQINAVPLGSAYGRLSVLPVSWLTLEPSVRWVAKQYLDKENEHPLGEFATVDVGASVRFWRARANIRVGNLLDREYADTGYIGELSEERLIPAAGRSLTAALTLE